MKITKLPNGLVRIEADSGKRLYNTIVMQSFSEVIVEESRIGQFEER